MMALRGIELSLPDVFASRPQFDLLPERQSILLIYFDMQASV